MSTLHPADDPGVPLLSRVLLSFVAPLLRLGGAVTAADLWPLRACDGAELLTAALRRSWVAECASTSASATASASTAAGSAARAPSFARAWARAFLPGFAHVAAFAWLKAMLALAQSRCVLQLLGVVADPSRALGEGLLWAALVGATGLGAALADAWYWRETWFFGHRWQCAAQGLLFEKATRLRIDALSAVSTGHAVSLATNDCERFLQVVHHLPHLVLTPLDGAVYAVALYADLGVSCFAGLGLMVLVSALQFASYSRVFGALRRERAKTTDARLNLTAQALAGIRVIKASGWEPPFLRAAREVRAREVRQLQSHYSVRGAFEGMIHSKYLLLTGVTILTMWARGERLTPEKVYSATALFYLLEMDRMWRFVENAENLADFLVSCRRFGAFLGLPEVVGGNGADSSEVRRHDDVSKDAMIDVSVVAGVESTERDDAAILTGSSVEEGARVHEALGGDGAAPVAEAAPDDASLAIDAVGLTATAGLEYVASAPDRGEERDADEVGKSCKEPPAGAKEVLNLSLRVRKGDLCAVVGKTGAGKSCLLLALLGELPVSRGRMRVRGSVSYAPQQPFVMSGTVRDNICFGAACDEARLDRVIECCCLDGEVRKDTIVGERGVTLSGGQRARLGLARCVYRCADNYLLDDPLSALDAEVGRRVFELCVRGLLASSGATVVLVTHQLRFLRAASSIVVLGDGGRVVAEGGFAVLAAENVGAALGGLLETWRKEDEEEDKGASEREASTATQTEVAKRAAPAPADAAADDGGARAFREDGGEGAVSMSVFLAYAKFWAAAEGGWLDAAHIVIVLVAAAVAFPSVGGYLGAWASLPLDQQQQQQPAVYYSLLLLAAVLLTVWRPVAFARRTVVSGKELHDRVFKAVLSAPTSFFDARPAGSASTQNPPFHPSARVQL